MGFATRARRTALLLIASCCATAPDSHADVVLDGTLGPEGPVAGGLVDGVPTTYVIDEALGRRAGQSLFHSLSRLSLDAGQSAAFTGVQPTAAVIARVTGGEPSLLDGHLASTFPGADLFLLNPAGVVVGPSGSFEVGGTLHLSTADALHLADGTRFEADPGANVQLSSAPPEAFGFLRRSPAAVELAPRTTVRGSLIASGGRVRLAPDGEAEPAILISQGGDVGLYATGGPSEVTLDGEGMLATPDARVELERARITLQDGDASGPGALRIRAGALVADGLQVISRSLGSGDARAVELRAASVELRGGTLLDSIATGPASGADLRIEADRVHLGDGSLVLSRAVATGAGGDVSLRAGSELLIDAASQVLARGSGPGAGGALDLAAAEIRLQGGALVFTETAGAAPGGNVEVSAGRLAIGSRARLASETGGSGAGGALHVAADAVVIDGTGGSALIQSTTASAAVEAGAGGDIELRAGRVSLVNGGQIAATTIGSAAAGDVRLLGLDSLHVAGVSDVPQDGRRPVSAITSIAGVDTASSATGAGGRVEIEAREITLGSGGEILARGFGPGPAGEISIDAERLLLVGGAEGPAVIEASAVDADAGVVSIRASESVRLIDGGLVLSATNGSGDGSRVEIRTGLLEARGRDAIGNASGLRTNTAFGNPPSSGAGGDVRVEARDVILADGARVTSETAGAGAGGAIRVEADRAIVLSGGAEISAASSRDAPSAVAGSVDLVAGERIELRDGFVRTRAESASGGAIRIRTRDLLQLVSSEISSRVRSGAGDGGSVDIDPRLVFLKDSRIEATAFAGDGGNVTIRAESLLLSAGSSIDATSRFGLDGRVEIDSPTNEITGEVDALPSGFLDPFGLLRDVCRLDDAPRGSLVLDPARPEVELP